MTDGGQKSTPLAREAALLLGAGINAGDLQGLLDRAEQYKINSVDLALLENRIDQFTLYRTVADQMQLPFRRSQFDLPLDTQPDLALRTGVAKAVLPSGETAFAMAPQGEGLQYLLRRQAHLTGVHAFITTPDAFRQAVFRAGAADIIDEASEGLPRRRPQDSAHTIGYLMAMTIFLSILAAVSAAAATAPIPVWRWLCIPLGFLFLLNVSVRLSAFFSASDADHNQAPPLADHRLPVYSIFVPLFREASVVRQLVDFLLALDYPPARLDIHILVEENDGATRMALAAIDLPPQFSITVLPPGLPQTKPRALNVGLALARGSLCTVYDAEDRPEPDQLRKAAALFAVTPQDCACLQARLAIDHADETWITKLFALEYASLFDVIIPGLAVQQLPFGLGGTSNHFRVSHLRAVGGWDAWNVTEDADIGMRLFRHGYRAGALSSTTFEEAPVTLRMWFNQRTRWMKGWVQTSLVHMRAPSVISARMMPFSWATAWALTCGTVLSALLGPALTALVAYEMVTGWLHMSENTAQFVIWTFALTLFLVGLSTIAALGVAGARRRHLSRLMPWVAVFPFYYLLMTAAAWRALADILLQPFHWRKTEHGLAQLRSNRMAGPPLPK